MSRAGYPMKPPVSLSDILRIIPLSAWCMTRGGPGNLEHYWQAKVVHSSTNYQHGNRMLDFTAYFICYRSAHNSPYKQFDVTFVQHWVLVSSVLGCSKLTHSISLHSLMVSTRQPFCPAWPGIHTINHKYYNFLECDWFINAPINH